jgi:tRNA A37 N6-isopentenylltransferase MiaA
MAKPAKKRVDDMLYAHAAKDVQKLMKQSRLELRQKERKLWKEQNVPNRPQLP